MTGEKRMKIPRPARRLSQRIRQQGWLRTIAWCKYSLAWRYREWRLGIRTAPWVTRETLGYATDQCGYEPIDYACLDDALTAVAVRAGEDVFLDYGCGKGRTLVVAAMHRFRRVIGVELSAELAVIAEQHVLRARPQLRCRDIEVVTADARTYQTPDDVTVVLMFNPFQGQVLRDALAQMRESLSRAPRRLVVIHTIPLTDSEPLGEQPWLREVSRPSTGYWDHVKTIVYESVTDPAPSSD